MLLARKQRAQRSSATIAYSKLSVQSPRLCASAVKFKERIIPGVHVSLDVFHFGLVFLREQQVKEHFVLRW